MSCHCQRAAGGGCAPVPCAPAHSMSPSVSAQCSPGTFPIIVIRQFVYRLLVNTEKTRNGWGGHCFLLKRNAEVAKP